MLQLNDAKKLAENVEAAMEALAAKWGVTVYSCSYNHGAVDVSTSGKNEIIDMEFRAKLDKFAKESGVGSFSQYRDHKASKWGAGNKAAATRKTRTVSPEVTAKHAVNVLRAASEYRFAGLAAVVERTPDMDRVSLRVAYQSHRGEAVAAVPKQFFGEGWYWLTDQASVVPDSDLAGPQPAFASQRQEVPAALRALAGALGEMAAKQLRLPEVKTVPESGVTTAKKLATCDYGTVVMLAAPNAAGPKVVKTDKAEKPKAEVDVDMSALL